MKIIGNQGTKLAGNHREAKVHNQSRKHQNQGSTMKLEIKVGKKQVEILLKETEIHLVINLAYKRQRGQNR